MHFVLIQRALQRGRGGRRTVDGAPDGGFQPGTGHGHRRSEYHLHRLRLADPDGQRCQRCRPGAPGEFGDQVRDSVLLKWIQGKRGF